MATTPAVLAQKFERTEDDIVTMAPIKAKFGDKIYEIKPLRILAQRQWRSKVVEEVRAIGVILKPDAATMPVFVKGLAFVFLQFPEKIADLVFEYAKDLPRETIEAEATEEQLVRVFSQIVTVAFPFVEELRALTQTVGIAASFPQLEQH